MENKSERIPQLKEILNKWSPIIENMEDVTLLPISMRITPQTIGQKLIKPISGDPEKMKEIREEVKIENRDRKIDSIIEDKDFEEMLPEDHPLWSSAYDNCNYGNLFYMDFKYNDED